MKYGYSEAVEATSIPTASKTLPRRWGEETVAEIVMDSPLPAKKEGKGFLIQAKAGSDWPSPMAPRYFMNKSYLFRAGAAAKVKTSELAFPR